MVKEAVAKVNMRTLKPVFLIIAPIVSPPQRLRKRETGKMGRAGPRKRETEKTGRAGDHRKGSPRAHLFLPQSSICTIIALVSLFPPPPPEKPQGTSAEERGPDRLKICYDHMEMLLKN